MLPDPAQYDPFADEYADHAATAPYNALYDRPATLELLGDVGGLTVFDAACGPGLYLEELVRRGARVVACDAAPRMVELARTRAAATGAEVDVRVHPLESPFDWLAPASVDIALCALAYHYVSDRPAFLREVRRVVRPGGRLVISTHHPTADWLHLGGSYFEVGTVTETWTRGWEITTWRMPLEQLVGEVLDAGFALERLVEPRPHPSMADSHPDVFDRLSTSPGFVLLGLRAPGGEPGTGARATSQPT